MVITIWEQVWGFGSGPSIPHHPSLLPLGHSKTLKYLKHLRVGYEVKQAKAVRQLTIRLTVP